MPLRVSCDSHHFASSVETVNFTVRPPDGKKMTDVRMVVTDRSGTEVYKKWWLSGSVPADRKFPWDGECNLLPEVTYHDGTTGHPYAHPLASYYKATFHAKLAPEAPPEEAPEGVSTGSDSGVQQCPAKRSAGPKDDGYEWQSGSALVRVLYREIKFEPVTWLDVYKAESRQADGNFPAGASDDHKLIWLNYKLHELGYVGAAELGYDSVGSVIRPEVHGVMRALFRYTQAHPQLPKLIDYQTLEAGAPGQCNWGWKDEWEARFGTFDNVVKQQGLTPDGDRLVQFLNSGDKPRSDLIEKPAALTDRTETSRIILDHDIHYINKDFSKPDGHAAYDAEFLNPICFPLQTKVLLVSKTDTQATKAGVDAPKAIGPLSLDWLAFDPPEDISVVPPPTSAKVKLKSKARGYLANAHSELDGAPGDTELPFDNCPSSLGGSRLDDAADMSPFFVPVHNIFAFPGSIPTIFRGSYIGGDNYVVQARLSLDGINFEDQIKADHKELSGLASCFGDPAMLKAGDADDPMVAQTGQVTIWRRHHVAREIRWGNTTMPEIGWFPVVDNFRAAHIILVPPPEAPIDLIDLFDDAAKQRIVDSILNNPAVTGDAQGEFGSRRAQAAIRRDSVYPLAYRTLTDFEASPLKTGAAANTQTAAERLSSFTSYLTGQPSFFGYAFFVDVVRQIRKEYAALNKPPGILIIRARYMAPPDFAALLPEKVFKATKNEQAGFAFTKAVATGMDYGVVMLDSINNEKYSDAYFTSHEISHCLFGSHPFEIPSYPDHDRADGNCIMYYPSNNDGLTAGWAMRSLPSSYKINVVISGTPRADSYGSLSSDFTKEDEKNYSCTGSLAEIGKALKNVKFSPAKGLAPTQSIELLITAEAGRIAPALSVPYPVKHSRKASDGSAKPFANITVSQPDLKAHQPQFCGKCVLKLRGWKVATVADTLPPKTIAIPVKPKMKFARFQIALGMYMADDGTGLKEYQLRGDPSSVGPGWPRGFLHRHSLTWESSDGDPNSLQDVFTREWVKFRTPTTSPPFSALQDPDQEFYAPGPPHDGNCRGTQGAMGGTDDHSTCHPALICCWPRQAGTLIAEQWYQWRRGNDAWQNIEGAAYLIEKSVFQEGPDWVFLFKKTNWRPHNPTPFHFEVHYTIPPPPPQMPAAYAHIAKDSQCGHEEADITKWARRVVSMG